MSIMIIETFFIKMCMHCNILLPMMPVYIVLVSILQCIRIEEPKGSSGDQLETSASVCADPARPPVTVVNDVAINVIRHDMIE